ncbi:MAG: carbohydrate ABC transporter permease [Propionibacteriaceae bacterium]|jgi:raffinose/stachyose/melibiose transport system permease protein|nr:carbohydrate ABC transporter permease [Propionibacteriaceae bacterium]
MISRFERSMNYVVLGVFAILILGPLVNIVTQSLGAPIGTSGGIHPENFVTAWEQGQFSKYLLNSVLVTVVVVGLSLVTSVLGGYALGTMRFPGSGAIFYVFLLGIMVPTEAIIVPLFFDLRALGLTDTVWGVALPQVAMSTAFGVYWMRTYFRSSNRAVSEAARIDGAGTLRTLWFVQLPIARPAIITLVVLLFLWTWNDFLTPLVMSPRGTMRTAPLGLAFFTGQHTTDTTLLAAAAILVALPVAIVYLFLQRHFIRGMIDGAVKD